MRADHWLESGWARPLAAALLSVGVAGCGGDPEWDAPEWETNTAEATAVQGQIGTLVGAMRAVEEGGTYDEAAIRQAYEEGSPSLQGVTHVGFSPILTDALAEFGELAQVGPIDVVDDSGAWTPGEHGGIAGSSNRGLNEGGLEIRQIVDKGLFGGGALYAYASDLAADGVDAAEVEAIAAVWGADATLSSDGTLENSANYANSMGFFDDVAVNLTAAHADPADEDALRAAFEAWELALYARFVHYMHEAVEIVEAEIGDESVAEASHELSEGLGLVLGFHGYDGRRIATDAQIERMMMALGVNVGDLGASTTGALLTDPAAFEAGTLEAEAAIAEAFGLSGSEVEGFRVETAAE